MRDWQWQEIVQHPERPLNLGQIELLREQNVAALSCERRSALCVRLLIEVGRLRRDAARLPRAVFVAEHLFQMIDPQTWRDSGGDDGQGHYEGDYRAETTRREIESWKS